MPTTYSHGIPIKSSGTPLPKGFMIPWYLFWVFVCIVCVAAGVWNYVQEEAFFAKAEHATATITDYVPDSNPKVSDFCPLYEFTTKAGQSIQFTGDICPSRADYSKVGQTEVVYYDPEDPRYTVQTRGWTGNEGSGLIFGFIMAAFFSFFWLVPLVVAIVRMLTRAANPGPRPAPAARGANATLQQDAERYHANQHAARRPPSDEEAQLARLKQQEAELQRKIEEHRRQSGQ